VHLWNAAGGSLRTNLHGHTQRVVSVAYSPDGKTLATGSYDGTVRLWGDVVFSDAAEAEQQICRAIHRNFTREERSTYLQGQATGACFTGSVRVREGGS